MASKTLLLVLACFLLVNTKVSSAKEEVTLSQPSQVVKIPPLPSPTVIKAPPPPSPIVKTPPPPTPTVIKAAPPPPSPIVKTPPPHPPVPVQPPPPPTVKPPRNRQECIPLCDVRCKNHSRKNICTRACLTCCERCKCVPPGQYGNKEKCGNCYAGMTTRHGKLKCP